VRGRTGYENDVLYQYKWEDSCYFVTTWLQQRCQRAFLWFESLRQLCINTFFINSITGSQNSLITGGRVISMNSSLKLTNSDFIMQQALLVILAVEALFCIINSAQRIYMMRTIVFIITTLINDICKFHKSLLFKRHRTIFSNRFNHFSWSS
jgi:hypothetical protein